MVDVEVIVNMYNSGKSDSKIAASLELPRSTVCSHLRKNSGRLTRGMFGKYKKGDRIKGKLSEEEIISAYSSTMSTRAVAEMDGCKSGNNVIRVLKKHGKIPYAVGSKSKHGRSCSKVLKLTNSGTFTRMKAIFHLGPKCVSCGTEDVRVLEINHTKEKKIKSKNDDYVNILLGIQKDVEVRCANCNVIYEYEKGARKIWWNTDEAIKLLAKQDIGEEIPGSLPSPL